MNPQYETRNTPTLIRAAAKSSDWVTRLAASEAASLYADGARASARAMVLAGLRAEQTMSDIETDARVEAEREAEAERAELWTDDDEVEFRRGQHIDRQIDEARGK